MPWTKGTETMEKLRRTLAGGMLMAWALAGCGGSKASSPRQGRGQDEQTLARVVDVSGVTRICQNMGTRVLPVFKDARPQIKALAERWAASVWAPAWVCPRLQTALAAGLEPRVSQAFLARMDLPVVAKMHARLRVPLATLRSRLEAQVKKGVPAETPVRAALFDRMVAAPSGWTGVVTLAAGMERMNDIVVSVALAGASRSAQRRAARHQGPQKVSEELSRAGRKAMPLVYADASDEDLSAFVAAMESPEVTHVTRAVERALEAVLKQAEAAFLSDVMDDTAIPLAVGMSPSGRILAACEDPPACQAECLRGVGDSCVALGRAQEVGKGIELDAEAALASFQQGCDLGAANGCLAAGLTWWRGMEEEDPAAKKAFELGCGLKDTLSCGNLLRMEVMRAAKQPARAGLGEVLAQLETHCHAQDPSGCGAVAWQHIEGVGVAPDAAKARQALTDGCRWGDDAACISLADSLYLGWGLLEPSPKEALEQYGELCNARGDMHACNNLGDMFETGSGTPADVPRALELYMRACRGGESIGCVSIAHVYEEGVGGTRDLLKAAQMYGRACRLGSKMACLRLDRLRRTPQAGDHATDL